MNYNYEEEACTQSGYDYKYDRDKARAKAKAKARARANPEIEINIGGGGFPIVTPSKIYYDSGIFEGVGPLPEVLSTLTVPEPAPKLARLQFSVNWMAVPILGTQEFPRPKATFTVIYENGIDAPQELMRIKEAVAALGMPTVTAFNMNVPNMGAGVYKLLAELDMSIMNDPENPGIYSFQLIMDKQ